ncbi:MAG: Methyltransferase domain protein [Candidatus Woesebacteria bacterium GW2011_GWA1_33_30]|uniref:Methyltransferase domain protein n=1 Tax=Candidatus Woesebacteria bacterium GW2011_GWA2_33_28 TaxID=1618561 RepID=A0A0F9ZVT2_9BACT|nr:MAG: Methyltransferase domain protein [Candidatus Woesebacteria bacterium GW2011_GWA2_33_28]KKP49101.1 MAG: Methyltransferase domain protein [Candidatus Woesebacteria bacterium GW2011_GWA1_33_30]KKP50299.1 MAG: Methyltransferase domain protein [Microgenomates group bacterium GW2011_GWC1_33_32]KKP52692.1 MAG: Methyltransferase domain protein [Candidatus Woesebacteria bacterium GW2011_GWB1_33_38]KKP58725.1 MAG: Methyltransferase domain protein [Microgenomates group bacterium GW2011_GWD1_33_9]
MKISKLKLQEVKLHKKLAKSYYWVREKNSHYKYFNNLWIEQIQTMLPKKKYQNTLDLGCGTVEFYELIKDKLNSNYLGVDLSPDMLNIGRKKYKNIRLLEADAENLQIKDSTFDLIIGRGIIHHLPEPVKGCEEAYRVLKKGGYFIVSEPYSNIFLKLIRKIYYRLSNHFSDTHKSFSGDELSNLLIKSGFVIKEIGFWGVLSFPFAFPDILPTYKFVPLPIFKLLVQLDKIIVKIPFIKKMAWHIIILCKKR